MPARPLIPLDIIKRLCLLPANQEPNGTIITGTVQYPITQFLAQASTGSTMYDVRRTKIEGRIMYLAGKKGDMQKEDFSIFMEIQYLTKNLDKINFSL